MHDENAPADDTADSRVEERNGQAESARREEDHERDAEPTEGSDSGVGITDADMDEIRSFLQQPHHRRSVDDLRPSSER